MRKLWWQKAALATLVVLQPGQTTADLVREQAGFRVERGLKQETAKRPHTTAHDGKRPFLPPMAEEKRLASIKQEMELMKKQRQDEMLKQPWFSHHQRSGATDSKMLASSICRSDSMAEEAVLNKQATLLQERTSALLTSLESRASALPSSVQPHVTPRSGGGEKSLLSEGTLRVPKAYYRGQVGDSLAQRDAELEALDRGVRRPRILYSYGAGTPPPELSDMDVTQEMQCPDPSAECAKIGASPDPEVGPEPEPQRGRGDFLSSMPVSGPCAECVTDVPGLHCVTDVPGQAQNSCSLTGGQGSQSLVSMLVRVMLGIVVAYGESREVRSVIDPVLSVVGEKGPAEASRRAGRAAVDTGRLLRHHTAKASQALGQRVVEATVASGKAVIAAGSRIVCGEPPEAKIGVVGMASLPSSQRRQAAPLYEFVGEKRSDAGNRPLHPNIVTVPQMFDPARAAIEGF
jgi:hypothetical protein